MHALPVVGDGDETLRRVRQTIRLSNVADTGQCDDDACSLVFSFDRKVRSYCLCLSLHLIQLSVWSESLS